MRLRHDRLLVAGWDDHVGAEDDGKQIGRPSFPGSNDMCRAYSVVSRQTLRASVAVCVRAPWLESARTRLAARAAPRGSRVTILSPDAVSICATHPMAQRLTIFIQL